MENVLDIYKLQYNEKNPVVNMDESPVQLIGETRIEFPMKEGKEKIIDSEYVRKRAALAALQSYREKELNR